MTTILCYARNRATSVEQIDEQTLISTCHLQDSLTDAYVSVRVRFPELEIISAEGRFARSNREECDQIEAALEKVKGVRIGAGMKKIIRGLTGEVSVCRELPHLIEECCHGVILAFTKDALVMVHKEMEKSKEFFKKMVKENIRLYNSCAAFAPGSPLVEGLEER